MKQQQRTFWGLVPVLLLIGLLTMNACQQEDYSTYRMGASDTTHIIEETFAYDGRDSLIRNTIQRLLAIPESKGFALHMKHNGARPLWNKAIHIGKINEVERLFIPLYRQGDEEIEWIWVIYADHG